MTKAIATKAFDYGLVDKDTKGKLVALAGQVRRYGESFKKVGMEIGEAIHEAHELLAGDGRDGKFKQWVESETDLGIRTAYNCMYVFQRSQKLEVIASFPQTVAYMLAAPSVPDAAIREVEKAVNKGQRPTVELAKATLKRFKQVASGKAGGKTSARRAASNGAPSASAPASGGAAAASEPATPAPDDTAGPLNDEPEPDLTFEEQVKRDNSAIESFCRGLTAHFKDNCPKLLSIDYMGRYDSALKQVEAACSTLRTCKYQDKPCPKCKGEGCETCSRESDYGAVSVLTYRQIAG